jgi:hypothetical protein
MTVPVLGVAMAVRMRMPRPIGMDVFVLVEDDLEMPVEGVSDPAERSQARHMVATFQSRDHGFGHAQPRGELLLRLARAAAQLEELPRAPRCKCRTVVRCAKTARIPAPMLHGFPTWLLALISTQIPGFANLRSSVLS